jgi:acyl-CoA synthetase (AMP-forming)/AMP-acid ligase II
MEETRLTLTGLLRERVKKSPQKPAILFGERRFTYAELEGQVERAASGLRRRGVEKGDKVAILLSNRPEFIFAVFATARIGAVFVPVNTAFTAEEAAYILDHSEASVLMTSQSFLPLVEAIRGRIPRVRWIVSLGERGTSGIMSWEELCLGEPTGSAAVGPEDLASITYTSGTTDRPKGVMLTQFAYCFAPHQRALALGWNETDRAIVVMPLFHVNALCHMAIALFSVGGSILLCERFSASRFWDEVREYGVTTSSLMRTIPQILLKLPERADDGANPLRLAVALLSPDDHLRFEQRFNLTAIPSYSLTEDILSVLGPLDRGRRKLGSCGVPIAQRVHRLRIVGEDGGDSPPGMLGEIVKQSPAVMKGYYKQPAATAEALKDGWLYTGDLGYLDENGYLFFVDRKKDMIKRGDENVSAAEVEGVLNAHPLIAEAAVVGVADPIRQEELKACIVLQPAATIEALPPEALWEYCQQRLAPFKVPRYLEYRRELPKTPSEKVQKHLLRGEVDAEGATVFDRLRSGQTKA